MAFSSICKRNLGLRMIFSIQNQKFLVKNVHNCESNTNDIDTTMDEFTTQLVQRKSDKWETIRNKKNIRVDEIKSTTSFITSEYLDIRKHEIGTLLNETFEVNDYKKVFTIVDQCIEYKICPSFKMLEKVLSLCAQNGRREAIISLQQLIRDNDQELMKFNSNYSHYLAEAIWLRGNITESLLLFEEVYRSNMYLRRKIRMMIKYLITNIISKRSEAALVTIKNFTEKLAKEFDDYFLLSYVWQACFLSEWYADQCTAAEILEKHEHMCTIIINRIPHVIQSAIREDQPETIHRLLEVLLKYNMKLQYTKVLQTLFNYRYRHNDLRSCAEIIQWSLELEVPLLSMQHEQFLLLFLGQEGIKKPVITPPNFQLKF